MITARMSAVTRPMASAIASAATSDDEAAIHTARALMSPVATGLSVRPAAASRRGIEGVVGPADRQLAGQHGRGRQHRPDAVRRGLRRQQVARAVMASDGPG